MKLNYFSETDTLYIELSAQSSVESAEVNTGVVIDYDAAGCICGIDIDQASKILDLKKLILHKLPAEVSTVA